MPKSTLTAASDHFWYSRGQHVASIWTTPESIRELSNNAFNAGARWAMRETTRLNPYVSQFIEMLILLGVFDGELETAAHATGSTAAGARAPGNQDGVDNCDVPTLPDDV